MASKGTARVAALLLTPGAGSGRDQPTLVAIDEALTGKGIVVRRIDFPYRLAGRRAPDRPPVLIAAIRGAAEGLAEELGVDQKKVALGGRSMGGRMCSMAVADGLPTAGLVLVSYPLHPPGKPNTLRTEHFPRIDVPCLFVSGDRDAFAATAELTGAIRRIPGPVSHNWIAGGDHSLRGKDAEVTAVVLGWLAHSSRRRQRS